MPTSRCVCIPRYFLFFFSSRRRHTRYWRDWSSDVCSSDLIHAGVLAHEYPGPLTKVLAYGLAGAVSYSRVRSEERRVGKSVDLGGRRIIKKKKKKKAVGCE